MNISRILALIVCTTLATAGIARADAWVYAKNLRILNSHPSSANCSHNADHFRCKTEKGREAQLLFEYAVNGRHLQECAVILYNRGSLWHGDVWRAAGHDLGEGPCVVHQLTANVFDVYRPKGK